MRTLLAFMAGVALSLSAPPVGFFWVLPFCVAAYVLLTVDGAPATYDVDTVVVCAGQESVRGLYDDLVSTGNADGRWLIGGADVAAELDAQRAIAQGTRVAAQLSSVAPSRLD